MYAVPLLYAENSPKIFLPKTAYILVSTYNSKKKKLGKLLTKYVERVFDPRPKERLFDPKISVRLRN